MHIIGSNSLWKHAKGGFFRRERLKGDRFAEHQLVSRPYGEGKAGTIGKPETDRRGRGDRGRARSHCFQKPGF